MKNKQFRDYAHRFVDWMADYLENIEEYPVKSQVKPGDIYRQLPSSPPDGPEDMNEIFENFQKVIIPGITHWQSPKFFAYFPANSSYPSLLAEMLTATLGAQCMKWETSPAATELEEMVMNWLKKMTGLPDDFHGVIQDTASTATLVALLTAREKITGYKINKEGFSTDDKLRVYASSETHSSIEKAAKIAGYGSRNLIKVEVDDKYALIPEALEESIKQDIEAGMKPTAVVATIGTTGSTAIDPLKPVVEICRKYDLWLHVDAAFAGSALILPEYRWMIEGVEQADSYVFNPHKWLFTNFDCSAYFVKDRQALLNTLQIIPEYLKTATLGKVNDYCDWGVQLGRRFRALKLWFVLRSYGVKALQEKLRYHIYLANKFAHKIMQSDEFELMAPVSLNLVCFRYRPESIVNKERLNDINQKLLEKVNKTGKIFISHTKLNGNYTLRLVTGNNQIEEKHIEEAWEVIRNNTN